MTEANDNFLILYWILQLSSHLQEKFFQEQVEIPNLDTDHTRNPPRHCVFNISCH